MKKLLRALTQWTLLIAIVVGAVGHSFFSQFTWLAPWLLASMLLLTFCNISPRDLRFHPLHLILMSLQIVMSLGLYALTLPWHPAIAQGVCMAALTPTATAAAIITGMLGGSVAFLAAYAFLSNLAIVVLAPLVLPLIATGQIDTPFQRVHARGAHHAFPPAGRLAHPIRRPQGQRRAAALGHSGLLPVGGDARHPYGRHL